MDFPLCNSPLFVIEAINPRPFPGGDLCKHDLISSEAQRVSCFFFFSRASRHTAARLTSAMPATGSSRKLSEVCGISPLTATPLLTLPGQEMAELTVNGQPAGVSFWPPHKFPLAGLLTPGENTLTLTLTGSPANRYGKHPVPYGLDT